MTTPDPYTPPQAAITGARAARIELPLFTFAALVAMQFLSTLRYSDALLELTRAGVISVAALFLAVPASLCLYLAAILLLRKGSGGQVLFLIAAAGLAITAALWQWPSPWSLVAAFGSALGFAGLWFGQARSATERPTSPATVGQGGARRRPIPVYIIPIVCTVPLVGLGVYISDHPSELGQLMHQVPLTVISIFLHASLVLAAGLLLLFMRKEAVTLFVMYLVWGLGNALSVHVALQAELELVLTLGVIVYGVRLWKQGLLR